MLNSLIKKKGNKMFDFESFPIKLSEKVINYICPECKYKFEAPIEAVLEFEEEWTSNIYSTIYNM